MTPGEVARALRVDPRTLSRWARAGRVECFYTAGGHRRYRECDVLALMTGARRG